MDRCNVACRRSYTIKKASGTMHAITTSLVETKQKLPGNVECLVSAYRIKFEQTEEHSGLTDKEERKTMKKRKMKTEKIKH